MQRCAPVRFVRSTASQSSNFIRSAKRIARDRGVVYQNVEPAEFRERLLKAGLHLRAVRHIHGHRDRRASARFDLAHQRRQLFRVARGHRNFRARLRQRQRVARPIPCDAPVTSATLSFS